MASPYDMSMREVEQHLNAGGTFSASGGKLNVLAMPEHKRFFILNDTGNGADHIVGRVATLLDLMEQYAGGSLESFQAEEPSNDKGPKKNTGADSEG